MSSFLFLSAPPSNLFKRHWIIPALGVNFFLIKVNCHLFLTLIFNTRHLVLVTNVTHVEKCELNTGAPGYQDASVNTAAVKAALDQRRWPRLGKHSAGASGQAGDEPGSRGHTPTGALSKATTT